MTADQLVAHAVGDYLLQSDWMAQEKVRRSIAALAHVATYGLPFLLLRPTLAAYLVIVASHFVIDRWRLARYVCWAKNHLAPPHRVEHGPVVYGDARHHLRLGPNSRLLVWRSSNPPWSACSATGYPDDRPPWMTVWLMIICDNLLHVGANAAALEWLA